MLREGAPGEVYNVGGPDEEENLDVVERILELTGRDRSLIEHVEDRKGHDRRYSLVVGQGAARSAGSRRSGFAEGLERTVDWYRDNEWWWEPIRSGEYREYYEHQYGRSSATRPARSVDAPPSSCARLTKRYDDGTLALENFDLEIPPGAFFGLLGPNGAGKTTAINAVCNLIRITSGEALVFGSPRTRSRRGATSGSRSRTSTSTAS